MTQEFLRRVDGYNFPFICSVSANVARNASLVNNAPAGPGRIESFTIVVVDVGDATTNNNNLIITIDGVVVFAGGIGGVVPKYSKPYWFGPFTAGRIGTADTAFEILLNLDYESSASVAIQNTTSPDPCIFYSTIFGRRGL